MLLYTESGANKIATQAVWQGLGYLGLGKLADQAVIVAAEVNHAVVLSAALELPGVLFADPGDQQSFSSAHHTAANFGGIPG